MTMRKRFLASFFTAILFASSLLAKTQFSSRYYNTSSDCVCSEKALSEGEDCTHFQCKEMAGYQIQISYGGSACDLGKFKVSKDSKDYISLSEVPGKVEWRFADKEPFAIIYRLKGPSKDCADQTKEPIQKVALVIAGLGKYLAISGQVDSHTSNANSKARDIADQAFLGKTK